MEEELICAQVGKMGVNGAEPGGNVLEAHGHAGSSASLQILSLKGSRP